MAEHSGRSKRSSNLHNLFHGFIASPLPTLEAPRSSVKGTGHSTASAPNHSELLPAHRTWIPALLIWGIACVVHLLVFTIALEQHRNHPLIDFGQHNDLLGFL